ncbi:hypothetical protein [Sandaracinus amylolyticus]|uniref:Uncharacterized protein n=1 Tax=Sandaracinus amylolyticus TaxID=927083 RepID=A0A0F6W2X2_9BACT|nr:hypothetical protein [Sandaracinus amylolyticus]AKF06093.1 hypothetical protein DB32_003242 [Sandaracinus amylolyticus]
MSSPVDIAIGLGTALLPPLIEEIKAALEEGLDEKAATERALERMRAAALPAPVSAEIAARFAAARAALPDAQPAPRALSVASTRALQRLVAGGALSHQERAAIREALGDALGR